MSHIHDALKKAQKEKGAHSSTHQGILPAGVYKPKFLPAKALWTFPVVLACVALVAYFWLSSGDTKPEASHPSGSERPAEIQQPPAPERAPIPRERPAAKEAAKPDVRVRKELPPNVKMSSANPKTGRRQTVENTRGAPRPEPASRTLVQQGPGTNARREQPARLERRDEVNRAPVVPPPPKVAQKPPAASNASLLYERARSFQKSGRLQEAKALYEKTLQEDPKHVDALNNMGVIYLHDFDYSAAREAFSDVIRLKPKYVDGYYNLACAYAMESRIPESLIHLKKAMSLNPSVGDWAKNDTDLANLRGVPDSEEIVSNRR
jgi:predicted Zn-dependent protease